MISIRIALPAEISQLQRIERDADGRFLEVGRPDLANGSTIPTDVAARAIAAGRIVVACLDDAVVGWIFTGRIDDELCVGQLSVQTSAGRRGIGGALLRHVIESARASGEASIVLNTERDVGWGRPFYERHGFAVIPVEEWTPALRMVSESQSRDGLDWTTRVHMRLRTDQFVD